MRTLGYPPLRFRGPFSSANGLLDELACSFTCLLKPNATFLRLLQLSHYALAALLGVSQGRLGVRAMGDNVLALRAVSGVPNCWIVQVPLADVDAARFDKLIFTIVAGM